MEDAVTEAESLLHKQEDEIEQRGKDSKQKETEVEERKGGLFDHIIHNLVSPLSPRAGDEVNQKKYEVFECNHGERSGNESSAMSEDEEVGNNGGGGLIKNVISNFFHQSEQDEGAAENQKKNEEEISKSVEENADVKKEDEGAGGIIDNIVSHLTTSLPHDVAPTTDEASILIHSIIHD